MSDPISAITKMDADDLTRIMSSGWRPQIIRAKNHPGPDHVAWTEVILRDWVEGLKILDQYHPSISRTPAIWRIALRNASHKCVEYLWNTLGLTADQFDEQDRQDIVRGLSIAMGEPWSPSYEIRDIQPMIDMFKSKGLDLTEVIPGEYENGDLREAGHSLFTRALSTRRWDVVLSTWPDPSKPLPRWPRLNEVLLGVLDVIGGNYRPLVASEVAEGRVRMDAVPFRQLYFKPGHFQQVGVIDDRFMAAWVKDFYQQWPDNDPELLSTLSLPSHSKIASWLRLPLLMEHVISRVDENGKPRMVPDTLAPAQLRKPIWSIWERVLSEDNTVGWLRSLAMYPKDPEVLELLDLLRTEAPHLLEQYWSQPSSHDGLSAAQIWDMQSQEDLIED